MKEFSFSLSQKVALRACYKQGHLALSPSRGANCIHPSTYRVLRDKGLVRSNGPLVELTGTGQVIAKLLTEKR